ncbi:MAG TPA: 50S ribosomal protein L10 [bacterium]|nr:50S ribosomal protein L10 [bacterium]HQO33082.1 50S ribosomal protein L10 [bacterium]HQP97231.1 50S ribosomal protein L10 [bacterium]
MKKAEKIELADRYKDLVDQSAGVLLFGYRGLKVSDLTDLRRKFHAEGSQVRVVRNRMLKRAVEGQPFAGVVDFMEGPTAAIFVSKDAAASAKTLMAFAKEHPQVVVGSGIVEKSLVRPERVSFLADLPSREVLQAQILTGIIGPMTGLAAGFTAIHQQLLGLFEAYRAKLEEAA